MVFNHGCLNPFILQMFLFSYYSGVKKYLLLNFVPLVKGGFGLAQ